MIQAVVFDLDGVLIDSEPINVKAAQQAFAEFGYTLSAEAISRIPGRHSADYVPIILRNNSLALVPEQVASGVYEHYQVLWPQMVVLMPQVAETLTLLKEKRLILALVTSANRSTVATFLEKFGFQNLFKEIVTADDIAHRKPHPEPYLKAIEKLNLPSESLLIVEDTALGITAAKAAGLRCVAIPNGYTKNQDFSYADHVLTSLKEIVDLVA
jgi:HAD superfamily hydrolase (TIGR01509 family)